eukprot:PhM_4_TR7014/c0_g2_i1/m.91185
MSDSGSQSEDHESGSEGGSGNGSSEHSDTKNINNNNHVAVTGSTQRTPAPPSPSNTRFLIWCLVIMATLIACCAGVVGIFHNRGEELREDAAMRMSKHLLHQYTVSIKALINTTTTVEHHRTIAQALATQFNTNSGTNVEIMVFAIGALGREDITLLTSPRFYAQCANFTCLSYTSRESPALLAVKGVITTFDSFDYTDDRRRVVGAMTLLQSAGIVVLVKVPYAKMIAQYDVEYDATFWVIIMVAFALGVCWVVLEYVGHGLQMYVTATRSAPPMLRVVGIGLGLGVAIALITALSAVIASVKYEEIYMNKDAMRNLQHVATVFQDLQGATQVVAGAKPLTQITFAERLTYPPSVAAMKMNADARRSDVYEVMQLMSAGNTTLTLAHPMPLCPTMVCPSISQMPIASTAFFVRDDEDRDTMDYSGTRTMRCFGVRGGAIACRTRDSVSDDTDALYEDSYRKAAGIIVAAVFLPLLETVVMVYLAMVPGWLNERIPRLPSLARLVTYDGTLAKRLLLGSITLLIIGFSIANTEVAIGEMMEIHDSSIREQLRFRLNLYASMVAALGDHGTADHKAMTFAERVRFVNAAAYGDEVLVAGANMTSRTPLIENARSWAVRCHDECDISVPSVRIALGHISDDDVADATYYHTLHRSMFFKESKTENDNVISVVRYFPEWKAALVLQHIYDTRTMHIIFDIRAYAAALVVSATLLFLATGYMLLTTLANAFCDSSDQRYLALRTGVYIFFLITPALFAPLLTAATMKELRSELEKYEGVLLQDTAKSIPVFLRTANIVDTPTANVVMRAAVVTAQSLTRDENIDITYVNTEELKSNATFSSTPPRLFSSAWARTDNGVWDAAYRSLVLGKVLIPAVTAFHADTPFMPSYSIVQDSRSEDFAAVPAPVWGETNNNTVFAAVLLTAELAKTHDLVDNIGQRAGALSAALFFILVVITHQITVLAFTTFDSAHCRWVVHSFTFVPPSIGLRENTWSLRAPALPWHTRLSKLFMFLLLSIPVVVMVSVCITQEKEQRGAFNRLHDEVSSYMHFHAGILHRLVADDRAQRAILASAPAAVQTSRTLVAANTALESTQARALAFYKEESFEAEEFWEKLETTSPAGARRMWRQLRNLHVPFDVETKRLMAIRGTIPQTSSLDALLAQARNLARYYDELRLALTNQLYGTVSGSISSQAVLDETEKHYQNTLKYSLSGITHFAILATSQVSNVVAILPPSYAKVWERYHVASVLMISIRTTMSTEPVTLVDMYSASMWSKFFQAREEFFDTDLTNLTLSVTRAVEEALQDEYVTRPVMAVNVTLCVITVCAVIAYALCTVHIQRHFQEHHRVWQLTVLCSIFALVLSVSVINDMKAKYEDIVDVYRDVQMESALRVRGMREIATAFTFAAEASGHCDQYVVSGDASQINLTLTKLGMATAMLERLANVTTQHNAMVRDFAVQAQTDLTMWAREYIDRFFTARKNIDLDSVWAVNEACSREIIVNDDPNKWTAMYLPFLNAVSQSPKNVSLIGMSYEEAEQRLRTILRLSERLDSAVYTHLVLGSPMTSIQAAVIPEILNHLEAVARASGDGFFTPLRGLKTIYESFPNHDPVIGGCLKARAAAVTAAARKTPVSEVHRQFLDSASYVEAVNIEDLPEQLVDDNAAAMDRARRDVREKQERIGWTAVFSCWGFLLAGLVLGRTYHLLW